MTPRYAEIILEKYFLHQNMLERRMQINAGLVEQLEDAASGRSIPFERVGSSPNHGTHSPAEYLVYRQADNEELVRKNQREIRRIETEEGLQEVFGQLDAHERNVIEDHLRDGLTFEQMAKLYGLAGKQGAREQYKTVLRKAAKIMEDLW